MKKTFKPRNKKKSVWFNRTISAITTFLVEQVQLKATIPVLKKLKEYELVFPRIYTGQQLGFRLVIEKSFYFWNEKKMFTLTSFEIEWGWSPIICMVRFPYLTKPQERIKKLNLSWITEEKNSVELCSKKLDTGNIEVIFILEKPSVQRGRYANELLCVETS